MIFCLFIYSYGYFGSSSRSLWSMDPNNLRGYIYYIMTLHSTDYVYHLMGMSMSDVTHHVNSKCSI